MDILVNVVNQRLKVSTNQKTFVAGTQEFIRFVFELSDDWSSLTTFAQFQQNGHSYNQYLDGNDSVYLPTEIVSGTCTLALQGNKNRIIAKSAPLTFSIEKDPVVSDAQGTNITLSLYDQMAGLLGDMDERVDTLETRMTALEENEVVIEEIHTTVESTLQDYLENGYFAAMTIGDGSISRIKIDSSFEQDLQDIEDALETAMQPSIYDPRGYEQDIFAYAKARADEVDAYLEAYKTSNNTQIGNIWTHIRNAYVVDGITYDSLAAAINGAVSSAEAYCRALLAEYEAFTVEIVDELPVVGVANTFYLLPNNSGTGYDKYWWIEDGNGNSMWDVFGSSSTLVVTQLPQVGEEDVDYILKSNESCLYYKYIDNTWRLIAGSLAFVGSTLPVTGDSLTDYYILQSGVYLHYRWINNAYELVGSDAYSKSQTDTLLDAIRSQVNTNRENIGANSTNISSLSNALTNLQQTVNNLDTEGVTYYATYGTAEIGGTVTENVFTLYEVDGEEETIVSQFVIQGGGGGGGQQTSTTLTVERITTSPLVVTPTDSVLLSFSYSSLDSDNEEVDGTYTWKLGSTVIATGSCIHGTNTFNATEYCTIGTQKFTLTVTDEGGSTVVKTWTVQKVDVRLESSFNDRITYAVGSAVNFTYTPYGSVAKTVHFILDGVELTGVTTSASGTLQSYSIPAQTHGAHLLECYITATINGSTIETEHIYKDIIWYDSTSTTPVIGCIYRCLPVAAEATYDENTDYYYINNGSYVAYSGGSDGWASRPQLYYKPVKASQYDSTSMDYVVYNPSTGSPTVTQTIDGAATTLVLGTYYDTLTYKTSEAGIHTIFITCGATTIGIIMDIEELDIDVSPVTANLAFDFNPSGYSNNSENRLWVDDNDSNIAMSVSQNFDWSNGGYQLDANGNKYFCIKAGTTATFSYKLFETSPYATGSHFKLIFKTDNIRDIDTTFMSCLADSVGIEMKAHMVNLKTSAETLEAPISEGDIIELEYNIQTLDTEDENATSLVMIYEDGVGYRPLVIDSTHRLHQYTPVNITFGSADCDVLIYRMKAYTASLTDSNTISNFIADALDSETMIARYNRNQIYNENSILTPESLAAACPDLKIIKIDAPKFTNNKSESISDTTIQCIHVNGDATLDNWTARNCQHSGQGTTSNEYGVAGRNLDLKMNGDDVTLVLGDGTTYTGGTGKVSLTRTSIPNNYFNVKVNIASSENANNALLANRYDRFLPYTTPAKKRNANTKTTMEFVNCVIFIRENDEDLTTHREFNDTNWHFYAIGNIGDSKKTDKTRVNDASDIKEFCNEILDNTLINSVFDTGVVNLIVESTPTTGNLFTDYYLDNGDGTFTLKRYLNNTWVTVSSNISTIQNGAVAIVSSLPVTGLINIEYYTGSSGNYTMYTWNGSAWSTGATRDEISNSHMANSISPLQWVAGNVKYDALYTAESGGKFGSNTYEFRYEHKSVTEAQHLLNMQIWRDMYAWVITSTDANFVSQLENWFIKESVLYYYLFTERYTMTDNRAKNSFWHWSKIYISETEAAGDYADVASYYTIDNAKAAINNGYRFDFWDYDNDTGLGINNSGEMKMTYGKEDIDYQVDNTPSSGYIFNGAESVFFRRVRLLLHDDLVSMYQNRESAGCWTSSTFISEFDEWQEQFPEELWRLDIERKYNRPYYGTSIDNSIAKSSDRFLKTMMNGRKKYHRRQFERDQSIYMGSKYLSSAIKADQIMFRCNTPQSAVVTPNYTLEIVPYSDMYLSVMFGNTTPYQVRAKAGQTYSIDCPLSTMDDTAILIYAASRIQALNDLSACYIHDNDFSNAVKLQTLVIGNTTVGYDNSFLTTLTLGNNALLTTLDVRNCSNLTGSLNLSYCSSLETLRAEGTSLTGVIFANNGKISTAYLPSTITSLTMRNLARLTTLNASLDNLESLVLENGALDSLSLLQDTYDTIQSLRLVGINWTLATTSLLNACVNMSSSYISGSVYISGQIRNQELLNYENAWSDLEVTYNVENLVTQYLATYVNADGTTLYTCYVDRGSTPPDPVTLGLIPTPTRASTEQYTFTYNGWDDITSAMLSARTITASYTSTVRTYTVTWYSRAGLSLGSVTANYGDDVTYSGDIPTNTSEEDAYIYNVFAGWDKSTGFIRGDTDVYAIWKRAELPAAGTDLKDMTEAEIYAVVSSGQDVSNYFEQKDYYDITLGHDFDFSNVESTTFVGKNGTISTSELYLDGSTAYNTGVKLFGEDEESFTLAIDFRFSSTTVNNTLLACFEEDGSEGFRLRYNSNANIQWGNMNHSFGNGKFRDIVVLRHKKGEAKLYIYASNASGSTSFSDAITRIESTRNRVTNTESTISLGAIRFLGNGGYDDYGTGMIYWCKLWHDDLGDENAKQLASWYHEKLRIEYRGTNLYRLAGNTSQRAGASFIANNLLGDRVHYMNSTNTNSGGWDNCMMRKNFMPRLYNALPTVWKSMVKKVKVNASAGSQSSEIIISEDYIYLPVVKEVDNGQTNAVYVSEGSFISWFTSNIRRAKFRGIIIPDTATYYTIASDPNTIDGSNVTIGDVWQPNGGTNTNYVFVSNQEIARCGYTVYGTATDVGGWVSANDWWLRSPNVSPSTFFWFVYSSGTTYTNLANNTFGVCPCFSI